MIDSRSLSRTKIQNFNSSLLDASSTFLRGTLRPSCGSLPINKTCGKVSRHGKKSSDTHFKKTFNPDKIKTPSSHRFADFKGIFRSIHSKLLKKKLVIPYLNNPHWQPRLLGQLLPDVPRRLRRLRERRLEHLQLLRLDRRPRAPPLVAAVEVVRVGVLRGDRGRGGRGGGGGAFGRRGAVAVVGGELLAVVQV